MNFATTIYLADDDPDDRQFITEAIMNANFDINIIEVEDGTQLITSIKTMQPSCISLILLDVNMPRMTGLEVLSFLKSDTNLCNIPTMMITTSNDKECMAAAYAYGVDSFITKPTSGEGYDRLVRFLKNHFRL